MKFDPHMTVVAIDGGGTSCRIALCVANEQHRVERGAANVTSDFDGAIREILSGLSHVADRAGLTPADLARSPAYLGLAGMTGPKMAARVAAALPFARVTVEDDRHAALRGALGRADGAVAHCGTGSFVAFQGRGATRLAGGWGSRLGDEASAQWLGRLALSAVLQAEDGLIGRSDLIDALTRLCGTPAEIVAFAATATPSEFGAFARTVSELAVRGDPVAQDLMRRGAAEIARPLVGLGWQPGMALCLTGGLGPHYLTYLPAEMQSAVRPPLGEPIDGALALARDFSTEPVT